jgi:hypothetical protein
MYDGAECYRGGGRRILKHDCYLFLSHQVAKNILNWLRTSAKKPCFNFVGSMAFHFFLSVCCVCVIILLHKATPACEQMCFIFSFTDVQF